MWVSYIGGPVRSWSALSASRRGGDDMLAKHPIDVMLTATDLGVAKRFYGDKVGLDVLIESEDFVTFGCGGDSRLVVTRTSSPSGEQQTKASWRVADVAAEVAELRARGVEVVEYDEPYLRTIDGVADVGFALSAWFVDPGGNTVGLLQFKEGIIAAATRFPGHLGVEVFRPPSASAGEYRVVYRFDSGEHLRAWLDSDEHAAWLERAEPHVIGPRHTQFLTGLESWFTLPGRPGTPPPPPYKMALLTWVTIFPLITGIVAATGPLLEGLPLVVRLGITTAVAVPLMTWVVMPRVTRLLRGWLYPDHRASPSP